MAGLPQFDGPENMRLDEELLRAAERGVVGWRVYGWTGPWVSLGRYQHPETALVNPQSTRWVMRPTGGKAVLHGHDVTVGLAVPLLCFGEESRTGQRSLKAVYRGAIAPIVAALRACGLPARLAESLEASTSPQRESKTGSKLLADCFAVTSPNDVVHEVTRAKVCGCALKVTRSAVLVQASIPAGKPLIDPAEVYDDPAVLHLYPWRKDEFAGAFEKEMAAFLVRQSPKFRPSGREAIKRGRPASNAGRPYRD